MIEKENNELNLLINENEHLKTKIVELENLVIQLTTTNTELNDKMQSLITIIKDLEETTKDLVVNNDRLYLELKIANRDKCF